MTYDECFEEAVKHCETVILAQKNEMRGLQVELLEPRQDEQTVEQAKEVMDAIRVLKRVWEQTW